MGISVSTAMRVDLGNPLRKHRVARRGALHGGERRERGARLPRREQLPDVLQAALAVSQNRQVSVTPNVRGRDRNRLEPLP